MQIELLPDVKYIKDNNLKPVTNPITFYKGGDPTPDGVLSTEIFGIKASDRKETPAYIPLNGFYLYPNIYKLLCRLDRNFKFLIAGNKRFSIVDGKLVPDETKGDTGLVFLYENWNKLKFDKNDSIMRNERVDLLTINNRNKVFMQNLIVIPAFYRDVNLTKRESGKIAPHEINLLYNKVIRYANMLSSNNNFDFVLTPLRASLQEAIVEIYDYFKNKLFGTSTSDGIIHANLMGKRIDYGVRTVMSAPIIRGSKPNKMAITYEYTGIPTHQVCSLFAPFVIYWVKEFFRREIGKGAPLQTNSGRQIYLGDIDSYFNEDYIQKRLDDFVHSYRGRFDVVEAPISKESIAQYGLKEKMMPLFVAGRFNIGDGDEAETSSISNRPMTWMDVFYRACVEVTVDKHVKITRYPFTDAFSSIITKVRVLSTFETTPAHISGTLYEFYPKVEIGLSDSELSTRFIDNLSLSNVYLKGMGGDYDGDQVTVEGIFTQEANIEAEKIMRSAKSFLDINGNLMRVTTNEFIQTLYTLTRD